MKFKFIKVVKFSLKLVISLFLCFMLIKRTDWNIVISELKQIKVYFLILALAIDAFNILVRTYKWRLLLEIQGAKLSLQKLYAFCYMGLFFNNFFPSSLGGDITRVCKTAKYTKSKTGAISAILMDKMTNLLVLVVIVFVAGTISLKINKIIGQDQLLFVAGIGLLPIAVVFCSAKIFIKYTKRNTSRACPKIFEIAEKIMEGFSVYNKYRRALFQSLLLSLFFYFVNIIGTFLFALTVGINIDIKVLVLIVPVVILITTLPISINGIGLQEGAFIYLFGQIGVDSSLAFVIALLIRFSTLFLSLIGAAVYLFEGSKFKIEEAKVEAGFFKTLKNIL